MRMNQKRTTPPPRVDVEALFPELADFRKTATRLFPRSEPIMRANESKLGGKIIWSQSEDWPFCSLHQVPYVALIQMNKRDVPELGFKPGFDVFQILWCPHSHSDYNFLPAHRIYWKNSLQIQQPLVKMQEIQINEQFINTDSGEFIPAQCRFYPEHIIEYPGYEELSQELQGKLDKWNIFDVPQIDELGKDWDHVPFSPGGWFYDTELSASGGSKIGGYPKWIQYPEYPVCACGKVTEHLLSISSLETVWGNPARRWIPIEEKHLSESERYGLHYGTNLMFGDGGIVYIFICRSCENWPISFVWQCG